MPYIEVRNPSAQIEHEATTSKISDDQLFYAMQRGLGQEEAVALIVNGFVRDVLQHLELTCRRRHCERALGSVQRNDFCRRLSSGPGRRHLPACGGFLETPRMTHVTVENVFAFYGVHIGVIGCHPRPL